jgi:hypothetical protein
LFYFRETHKLGEMEKQEIVAELLALPPADQMEILKLLQERAVKDTAHAGAREQQPMREKPRGDPWGSVYQELTKTFRRPVPR